MPPRASRPPKRPADTAEGQDVPAAEPVAEAPVAKAKSQAEPKPEAELRRPRRSSAKDDKKPYVARSEEHTSELQSH